LREIRWSVPAAETLSVFAPTSKRDNPEAARRVAQTIFNGCEGLKKFPHLGRPSVRVAGRRELVFPPLPYIVVYRLTDEALEISHIFHGAQDRP
jgi:toxin ParE1/3/4